MRLQKLASDFKTFALRGNVMDLAVGVMVGGAFGKIVSSLVSDILTPLIGALTGGLDFSGLFISLNGKSYATLDAAKADNAGTLNYGAFLTSVIDFLLIAICIFILVRLLAQVMPKKEAPKDDPAPVCPFCFGEVNPKATRCPHCTSELPVQDEATTA